jgi:hypothetical protein
VPEGSPTEGAVQGHGGCFPEPQGLEQAAEVEEAGSDGGMVAAIALPVEADELGEGLGRGPGVADAEVAAGEGVAQGANLGQAGPQRASGEKVGVEPEGVGAGRRPGAGALQEGSGVGSVAQP